ncbi:DNA cytosine methyltransferase [Ruegeria sp. HKCCA0370]|uniref:DNA cytosine methyltransferase n=1 Tax=Ruegeria sp. HKCCA0370 TaxID=2682995 RepID=UPI0014893092|nr:DNA cytosine methyltransferase [Ruegeria sp. HKCCA0370]
MVRGQGIDRDLEENVNNLRDNNSFQGVAVDDADNPKRKGGGDRLLSVVDLFAGCGGLSLGFENSGFTPVFVNELNDDARATYLANRHHSLGGMRFAENEDLHCQDAHELVGNRLRKLEADLAALPELGYSKERARSWSKGGGSNIDVLAGGPPCQGFSGIGIRRSYDVDKKELPSNQLYEQMANVIEELRPRIFLFENVRGLLHAKWTKSGGELIFPDVLKRFKAIPGYEVRWSLVHAKDYGVPQNRPRVLVVGIRKDVFEACSFLEPSTFKSEHVLRKGDAVEAGFLPAPRAMSFPHLEDLLGDLVDPEVDALLRSGEYPSGKLESLVYPSPKPLTVIQRRLRAKPSWMRGKKLALTEQEYSRHNRRVVAKFIAMHANNGEIPEEFKTKKFAQKLLPASWGNGEPTITATSLPDDYVHFSQPRVPTVREWARLQLFPDWYQFRGKRTTGGLRRAGNPREGVFDREVPKYTQIGNAVPVGLAEAVSAHFRQILEEAVG